MNFKMIMPAAVIAFGAFFFGSKIYGSLVDLPIDWDKIRDWVGAFSGYLAIYVAYKALQPVREQLTEMKNQSRSIAGNDPPTLEVVPASQANAGEFRVINWNKNAIYITMVRWDTKASYEPMDRIFLIPAPGMPVTIKTMPIGVERDGSLQTRVKVPGWEDRSKSPPSVPLVFPFRLKDNAELGAPGMHRTFVRLTVGYYFAGGARRPHFVWEDTPLPEMVDEVEVFIAD